MKAYEQTTQRKRGPEKEGGSADGTVKKTKSVFVHLIIVHRYTNYMINNNRPYYFIPLVTKHRLFRCSGLYTKIPAFGTVFAK